VNGLTLVEGYFNSVTAPAKWIAVMGATAIDSAWIGVNRPSRQRHPFAVHFRFFKETIMGLFDAFKSAPPALTPRLALAVGLLFMMAADGQVEEEEVGQLRSVVGGDKELIQTAVKYLRSVKYEQYLVDSAALLNEDQKLCLLINMADSLLSDGRAELSEQQTFSKALAQFGLSEDAFKPHFATIALKNNRAIF
jgi:uncharacterized tellurite resistance protein B-like protein